jgi:hypothetical protein
MLTWFPPILFLKKGGENANRFGRGWD